MRVIVNIYADFNGVESCVDDDEKLCLDLTGFGTLASLSAHGIKLERGKEFTFVDADGLTVHAIVEFDPARTLENCSGWFARFREIDLFYGAPIELDHSTHLCLHCRRDIKPHLKKVGQNFAENCPFCGVSVMAPLAPPAK